MGPWCHWGDVRDAVTAERGVRAEREVGRGAGLRRERARGDAGPQCAGPGEWCRWAAWAEGREGKEWVGGLGGFLVSGFSPPFLFLLLFYFKLNSSLMNSNKF